jgi:alpha-tubulin suppressor-like RCC1 family protein
MTSCGDKHTLLLTIDGRLWSTGRGREGQLSNGIDNQDIYAFRKILVNGFDTKRVITATAGDGHSTAVREDGAVFTWGAGYSSNLNRDSLKYLMRNAISKMQPAATRYAMITRGDMLALAMGTHQRLARKDPNSISPLHQLSEMTEILKMIWDAGRNEPLPSHVAPHHEGLVRLIGGGRFD